MLQLLFFYYFSIQQPLVREGRATERTQTACSMESQQKESIGQRPLLPTNYNTITNMMRRRI